MSDSVLKDLLKEYEIKRLHAEQLADEKKDQLFKKYPELEKINSEKAPNIGTKTIEDGIYEIHSCIDDNKLLDVKEQSFNSGANIYISKKQCTKSKI